MYKDDDTNQDGIIGRSTVLPAIFKLINIHKKT